MADLNMVDLLIFDLVKLLSYTVFSRMRMMMK